MGRSAVAIALVSSCLVVLSPVPAESACSDPPAGLVAWWGADGNAGDVFGTWNGALVGDTTYGDGLVGQAFSFDGAGDRVDLLSDIGDFAARPFTVELWLYPNAPGTDDFLIGKSNANGGLGWDMRLGAEQIKVVGVNGWGFNITSDASATQGAWHHVALSSTASEVKLYVDGAPKGSCPRSTISSTGNPLRFGFTTDYASPALNGLMDEIKVYDRALEEAEIQAIHAAGADGSCRPCGALPPDGLAWWRAEDNPEDEIDGFEGTLGGDTSYVNGKVGRAFSFDGDGDFVEAPDSAAWDFGLASFSVAAWIRSPEVTYYSEIVVYQNGTTTMGAWWFRLDPSGKPQLAVCDQVGYPTCNGITGADEIDDGEWHFVAGVRDAAAGELRLYVDGLEANPPVSEPGLNVVGAPDNRLLIGAGGWGGGGTFEPFAGEIDEAMIFTRALSEAEIAILANAASSGVCTACTEPPLGQVSLWRGDGSASDALGANHGVEANGATYAAGLVGQAFSLEGSDDFIEVADDPSLRFDPTDPMSIDLWAYRTGDSPGQHLIGKRSGCSGEAFNYQIDLDLVYNNGLCFAANASGAILACSTGGAADLPLGVWTHVAATFDGSTMRLYIDGQEAASTVSALGTPDSAPLRIGTSGCVGDVGYDFAGLIDEVEIHDRALSRDEVYAVYAAGVNGKCGGIFADGFESGGLSAWSSSVP